MFVCEIEEPQKKEACGIPLDSPPTVWEVEPLTAAQIELLVLPTAQEGEK